MVSEKPWWVYIIETDKGQLYTGITTDVERRWQEHCAVAKGEKNAKGAKFFRTQSPQKIAYQESFTSRSDASKREAELKKMNREQKMAFLQSA